MDRSTDILKQAKDSVLEAAEDSRQCLVDSLHEIRVECIPSKESFSKDSLISNFSWLKDVIHVPYSPALTRPGWFVNLINEPKDHNFWEGVYGDIFAGFTVGFAVIPQALSYAALAGLPPINGLYTVIMPSVMYIILGSGMQLAVGPVALVSLLMGELVTRYDIDSATDPELAVDFAAEVSFCVGLLLTLMGLFNLGNLIRFISYPVMTGFTTASAMIIGLQQIKNAFGFPSTANVPQVGGAVDYNYEVMKWYMENWNGRTSKGYLWRNVHAVDITFGIWIPLFLIFLFKTYYKFSEATKKTIAYQIYNFIMTFTILLCLIISGHEAWIILTTNFTYHAQHLKVVGDVPAGLSIFRTPRFRFPLKQVIVDVIPMTIISYMEGYAVARKTSASRGQLSILNASQELFALGVGNMLNTVSSGYPATGSFSRSSLYSSCGARTPLAKTVTLTIVLVALGTLTKAFYYIPQAALAAVVMIAILGLIDFHEFWVAWKLSKKDFFVMFVTFILTFVFDTEVGLLVGFSTSLIVLLKDLAYSLESKPISRAITFKGVEIIRLNGNLVFVSATTIKDTLVDEIFERHKGELRAVVLDFVDVKHADLSGLIAMREVMDAAKKVDMRVFLVNLSSEIQYLLDKAGIVSDDIDLCTPDLQASVRAAQAVSGNSPHETLDVESLGMVQDLLSETRASSLLQLATISAKERTSTASMTSAGRPLSSNGIELTSMKEGAVYSVVRSEDHED